LKKKSSLILFGLLLAGVNAGNLKGGKWADPYCNTFSADGTVCLKCSYHYWQDSDGACQPVSDWCKTWDDKNGCCTSCFEGYGEPINGVCASTPVVEGGGDKP